MRFHDCSWYAACKVKTLGTSTDGFRSGVAIAKKGHEAKKGHDRGWVQDEDAQRAYERRRLAKYASKLEAELGHEAASTSGLWRNRTAGSHQLLLLMGVITAPADGIWVIVRCSCGMVNRIRPLECVESVCRHHECLGRHRDPESTWCTVAKEYR